MTSCQSPTTASRVIELLQKLTTDIDQMRALFCAIEDRAMDGGLGLDQGSVVAMHFEALAHIGSDIADRNADATCNAICALRDAIKSERLEGGAA